MTAIAIGDFVAILAASSKVNCSSSADPTRWLTSSHSLAFWASRGAAVKNSSLMRLMGSRPRKWSNPVVLYGSPRFAGVMANVAVSSATTRSQLSTRSSAPPQTVPCTMATTGAGKVRMARTLRKLADVMASGPDAQSRRGAQHDGAYLLGLHAAERGDDASGNLAAEGVAPALVIKGDDANLPEDIRPDAGALVAASGCRG